MMNSLLQSFNKTYFSKLEKAYLSSIPDVVVGKQIKQLAYLLSQTNENLGKKTNTSFVNGGETLL